MGRSLLFPLVLVLLTLVLAAGSILLGEGDLGDLQLRRTFLELRAARIAVAFLAGAALSVGGVLVQGLFRNPLASPSVIGTTAGASLGGQVALLVSELLLEEAWFGVLQPELVLPLGCFVGAWLALLIVLSVVHFRDDLVVLLLTGFLLSSLFLSLGSFLTSLSQESWELGRALVAFTLGGVGGSGLPQVLLVLPLTVGGVIAAWFWARPLDMLLTGEEEASSLGLDVRTTRRWVIAWTAVLTAGAVAVGGNVGFVGLIIPHALRSWVGVQNRALVVNAALLGGAFLIACDMLSRAIPSRSEIPLGVLTGMIGAPLFLFLLIRQRRFDAGVSEPAGAE